MMPTDSSTDNSSSTTNNVSSIRDEIFRSSLPYVIEGQLKPPVGLPADFVSELRPFMLHAHGFPNTDE
jgi:hypothetical protein